jgi:trehalose 6-phosphate phosphatase
MSQTRAPFPGMRNGTWRQLRAVLASRPRALLTDIDGTISAIAPTPDSATILPGISDKLIQASDIFDVVATISGRSAQDARRLVGLSGLTYIGNHGMEQIDTTSDGVVNNEVSVLPIATAFIDDVNEALNDLEQTLASRFPGLLVERKGVTGSIHYRQTDDPFTAEKAIIAQLDTLPASKDLTITRGKLVIEVRPPVKIDKGTSIKDLVTTRGLEGGIFFGDDWTDIDGFRALHELTIAGGFYGFAVAVLHPEAPKEILEFADFALNSIEEMPLFLDWLLDRARNTRHHVKAGAGITKSRRNPSDLRDLQPASM